LAIERLGWGGLAVLIAGLGPPYILAAAGGLGFAPAADLSALNAGCMPLFVAALAAAVADEPLSPARLRGLALIVAGALAIVAAHALGWRPARLIGDGLFLLASLLSACFTVVMRRAALAPLHAVALVATGSLALYLPVYLAAGHGAHLVQAPRGELVVHAAYQGVLVTIVSLVLYGRAVVVLGAAAAAAFAALVPVLSALFAILLLHEYPSAAEWLGIGLISAGVYLASGASPAPRLTPDPAGTRE
jgi:drug/metabolite transporter (DMT)-like permease